MEKASNEKIRLDIALTERGLCESREKAKALIMSGNVLVDGERQDKPGYQVRITNEITILQRQKYVSRGGLKLEKAIEKLRLDFSGLICMDVGASTGGFTDCMLKGNAAKVYSIDVGYGQLAWEIRNNPNVVNMERTNFRYLTKEHIDDEIDFAAVDVSFISLTIILPVLHNFVKLGGQAVILIKPQFEAGRNKVGKKGVVKERAVHIEVLEKIFNFCAETGFSVLDIDFSPVKGPEGNIEYLFYIAKDNNTESINADVIIQIVDSAHSILSETSEQ